MVMEKINTDCFFILQNFKSTWYLLQFGPHRLVQEAPNLRELRIYRDCDDGVLEEISQLEKSFD